MATAVKKTISLPQELAKEAESMAREEGKTLSAVIQEALRLVRKDRLRKEFFEMQDYWSRKAKEKGILNTSDIIPKQDKTYPVIRQWLDQFF